MNLIKIRSRNLFSDVILIIECLQTMVGLRIIMQRDDSGAHGASALTFGALRVKAPAQRHARRVLRPPQPPEKAFRNLAVLSTPPPDQANRRPPKRYPFTVYICLVLEVLATFQDTHISHSQCLKRWSAIPNLVAVINLSIITHKLTTLYVVLLLSRNVMLGILSDDSSQNVFYCE